MRLTVSRTIASSSTTKTTGVALIASKVGAIDRRQQQNLADNCVAAGVLLAQLGRSFPQEAATTRRPPPISAQTSLSTEAPVAEPAWTRDAGFQAVFESAPIGIAVVAMDGRP